MKLFLTIAALAVAGYTTAANAVLPTVTLGAGTAVPPLTPFCQNVSNRTLSPDTLYILTGLYYVEPGDTITIQPGTVIKGDDSSAGTLIITRGAKIFAQGTKFRPIVFTSEHAPGARASGDWGGIIILGNAPTNKLNPVIEGGLIAGSCGGGSGTYGGPDANDSSGIFSYVRIEFPGFRFALNNEVNGLTMGGVGAGTQIDHVQVTYSDDDSFEWFGGTVNCSYLTAFGGTDDEFDTDFGYSGKVQFGFGLRDPSQSDPTGQSNGYESDNDATGTADAPITDPVFCNMTLIGPERNNANVPFPLVETFQYSALLRRNVKTDLFNSVVMGYPWGISLIGANTIANATGNELEVEYTSMQATLTPTGSTHMHNETGWTSVDAWWGNTLGGVSNPGNLPANSATRLPDTIKLNNMSSLTAPDPRPVKDLLVPANTSELVGSANFANPRLAGLPTTTYRGAFPDTDTAGLKDLWIAYWTNFDAQNTNYDDGITTGVEDGPEYASYLSQNYPNPFNPQTTIDFTVPATGRVTLDVFNASGAKVASLANDVMPAGKHSISFNAKGLASGVYFYRLKGNGFNEMRKMVLLK